VAGGAVFWPWAEISLNEIPLSLGGRILDIACGTGIVARQQRKRVVDAIVSERAVAVRPYADGSGPAFALGANLATAIG
jgi:hypothetical protein